VDSHIDTQVTFLDNGGALVGSLKIGLYEFFGQIAGELASYADDSDLRELKGLSGNLKEFISQVELLRSDLAKEGDFDISEGSRRTIESRLREVIALSGRIRAEAGKVPVDRRTREKLEMMERALGSIAGYELEPANVMGVLERLGATERTLKTLGFKVSALPWMGINKMMQEPLITYNNVRFFSSDSVHMPVFRRYPKMNARAREVFGALGYKVFEVEGTETATRGGAVQCMSKNPGFTGVIDARSAEELKDPGYFYSPVVSKVIPALLALSPFLLFFYHVYRRKMGANGISEATKETKASGRSEVRKPVSRDLPRGFGGQRLPADKAGATVAALQALWEKALAATTLKLRLKNDRELLGRLRESDRESHRMLRFYLAQGFIAHMGKTCKGIRKIWLYGSVDDGSLDIVGPGSDIDLLFEAVSPEAKQQSLKYLAFANQHLTRLFRSQTGINLAHLFEAGPERFFLKEEIEADIENQKNPLAHTGHFTYRTKANNMGLKEVLAKITPKNKPEVNEFKSFTQLDQNPARMVSMRVAGQIRIFAAVKST
ncbi:MAG: hypothetical protein WCK00_15610, partial [Deltaproteobacteria bacterium]